MEGTPSVGSLAPQDGSLVWRVVTPGRWFGGKTGEATLSATVLTAAGREEPGFEKPEAGPMDYTVRNLSLNCLEPSLDLLKINWKGSKMVRGEERGSHALGDRAYGGREGRTGH